MAGEMVTVGAAMPDAATLAFADAYVREGACDVIAAAKAAGHGDIPGGQARDMARRPSYQQAIKLAISDRATSEGLAVALQALISIARDGSASEDARVKAALGIPKLIAAMQALSGIQPAVASPSASPSGKERMTPEELLRTIRNIAEGSAHAIDVTSR